MERRKFIGVIGAAAAWPLGVRGQSRPQVIGVLGVATEQSTKQMAARIKPRLAELGFVEGSNLVLEYRWADYQQDRLPVLVNELVALKVSCIVALGGPPTVAAKNATKSIPIIFQTGFDPVVSGYVSSMNRPGGNVTGAFILNAQALLKRLQFLHELVPAARTIAFFWTDTGDKTALPFFLELQEDAKALGVAFPMFSVTLPSELEDAFVKVEAANAGALLVNDYVVFSSNVKTVVDLAARYKLPTMYPTRSFVAAGGLVSYGNDTKEAARVVGDMVGRVLRGERTESMPVQQVTKLELVINARTARSLGLDLPVAAVALAELIE